MTAYKKRSRMTLDGRTSARVTNRTRKPRGNAGAVTPAQAGPVLRHSRVTWFDERFYRVEAAPGHVEFYPSVTTVLGIIAKPYLADFRGRVGNDEADYKSYLARTRGTEVHEVIHRLLKGERVERGAAHQETWRQVVNFAAWFESLGPARVVATEETVYSRELKYAGTVDAVIETAEGLNLVDFKTGATDPAHLYQAAAYAKAWEEMYPKSRRITSTAAVYLKGAQARATWANDGEVEANFTVFSHALEVYLAGNSARPKIFDMPKHLKLKTTSKKPKQGK